MTSFAEWSYRIFDRATHDYHVENRVDVACVNPYEQGDIAYCLYKKNWVDAIQWHLEDMIRDPEINPETALQIKRQIDRLNQERTDIVEYVDAYFFQKYSQVKVEDSATWNTESPAWALDRLSILSLKIYHMQQEVMRKDISSEQLEERRLKLEILKQQQVDLIVAIDQLLVDIQAGRKYMKVYKQLKMYNDSMFNPVLYGKKG